MIGNKADLTGQGNIEETIDADSVKVLETNLQINNPNIWSPHSPNLYVMKVSVYDNETLLDQYTTQFGIRTVKTFGNKFLLNGRIMFNGTARHEDHPVYGRSLPKEIIFNDLQIVKSLNVNFIRNRALSEPSVYILNFRQTWNNSHGRNSALGMKDTDEPWQIQNNDRKMHLQMFREMVFKEYNRPSVIMWSMSNECHEETNRLIFNQMVIDDIDQNYYDGKYCSLSRLPRIILAPDT